MTVLGRLCEFADVRNRAAQFFAFKEIFIALKQTFVNRHNRPKAEVRLNEPTDSSSA
jgi:hypothetical protein